MTDHRAAGRFLALEGPDGVGKTPLAALLADTTYDAVVAGTRSDRAGSARRRRRPLVFVSRREVSRTSAYSEKVMGRIAKVLWDSGDSPDLPDAFWVHAQAAWFAAHASTVLAPVLATGYDVLVDGWVYKFFSKLLGQGHSQADLDIIFGGIRMPDAALLLTADISNLYDRRRSGFHLAELGMHAGCSGLGRDTFVEYQRRGLRHLSAFAARFHWPTVELNTENTVEECVAVLALVLAELRAAGPQEPVVAAVRERR